MQRALALALLFGVAACESDVGVNQAGGALVGGALGGVAGSQIGSGKGKAAATGAGVALGLVLGSEAGRSLDLADRTYAERTTASALETTRAGQSIRWYNPDTGNSGTITPQPAYLQPSTGLYCREFQQTIMVGGQPQAAYGTACRQPDGTWQIMQ